MEAARLTHASERSTAATPAAVVMPSTARRVRPASTQPVRRLDPAKPSTVPGRSSRVQASSSAP